ncbi:MAG: AraC family transcriptional regulator [Fimbriimonas sp.]
MSSTFLTSEPPKSRLHWAEAYPDAPVPVAMSRGEGFTLNEDVIPHDHDFFEIAIIFGGTGLHVVGEGQVPLQRGSLILLRPGTWHAFEACQDLTVVNLGFAPSFVARELRGVLDTRAAHLLAHGRPVRHAALAEPQLRSLEGLLDRPDPQSLMGWSGLLLLVLDELVRALPATGAPIHPAVIATLDAIEAAPERPWTLDRLARRSSLNASYLSRLFRDGVGLPPLAYLNQVRAERAATLLLRSDIPVNEVGTQVGWPDPSYFARRFRAHFGVSPTAYRARSRT